MAADRRRSSEHTAPAFVAAALDSPAELRAALDAGADDVIGVTFEPEVVVARAAAGLRAARLRSAAALDAGQQPGCPVSPTCYIPRC